MTLHIGPLGRDAPRARRMPARHADARRPLCRLALALLAGSTPAVAQQLTDGELRAEIAGNTLTGFHDSGMSFTEYHSPDGRVFGFNGGEPVQDGCWRVRDEAVCYDYGRGRITGSFCWRFDRAGSLGYRIAHVSSGTRGVARLEPGNPKNLSDNGRPWDCADQISRLDASRRSASR